jgi:hypothetical protein
MAEVAAAVVPALRGAVAVFFAATCACKALAIRIQDTRPASRFFFIVNLQKWFASQRGVSLARRAAKLPILHARRSGVEVVEGIPVLPIPEPL